MVSEQYGEFIPQEKKQELDEIVRRAETALNQQDQAAGHHR